MPGTIRDATAADAAACRAIYAPYVEATAISFEAVPPTVEEMAGRIAAAQEQHAWLVLDEAGGEAGDADGRVVGYAYGGPFMSREAYRWACSVSVYTEQGRRRTGAGRALYTALLDRLAARGLAVALAGIALPNDASLGLHRAMGFEPVGTYRAVGWKAGRWHDVTWVQRRLDRGDGEAPPPPPRPLG